MTSRSRHERLAEEVDGVQRLTIATDLEVQVRAGRAAAVADAAQGLSAPQHLAVEDEDLRQVRVARAEVAGVLQDHLPAVAGRPAGPDDAARRGGADDAAVGAVEIDSGVVA